MNDDLKELNAFREQWLNHLRQRNCGESSTKIESESDKIARALMVYKKATKFESDGQLGEALRCYQEAFHIEPSLDEYIPSWQSMEDKKLKQETENESIILGKQSGQSSIFIDQSLLTEFSGLSLSTPQIAGTSTLKQLFKLPHAVLSRIFEHLACMNISSMIEMSCVCRYWYVLARDNNVWRSLCNATWTPPVYKSLSSDENVNYCSMYMNQLHIRWDGIYIAEHHYLRVGESATSYSNPVFLVTYYRYLRFFKNKLVVSLLSNDGPKMIVPQLKRLSTEKINGHISSLGALSLEDMTESSQSSTLPFSAIKRILIGEYEVQNDRVAIHLPDPKYTHQQFEILLQLSSTHPGANNRLKWIHYASTSLKDNTSWEFELEQLRSFWFSKIRSLHTT